MADERMMQRIAILADLPLPEAPVIVREVSWQKLWEIRPGKWAVYLRKGHSDVHSLKAEVWHAPGYAHLRVHEYCHHVQQEAGEEPASPKCEEQAYRIQAIYFRLFLEDWKEEWNP